MSRFGGRDVQAPRRLRILMLTPYLPGAPTFGGARRLFGILAALAKTNDVTVLSFADPHEDQRAALETTRALGVDVVTVPHRRYFAGGLAKRAWQLGATLSPYSYEWLLHRDADFQRAFDRLVREHPFDVVHYEFPFMASYGRALAALGDRKPIQILDEHNIEFDLCQRVADASEGPVRRGYAKLDGLKLRREEKDLWRTLDGCAVTSTRDRELLLGEEPSAHVALVPNGVDLDSFEPSPDGATGDRPTVLFFGAIDYYPNTDGLLFFLRDIWPRVRATTPNARLRIVGRRPPPSVTSQAREDIEVTGVVDDVRPEIAKAAAVIVPLRIGGGTRLKILEAMAMGKAIVSTPIGAEGIAARDGRELLLTSTVSDFAIQVSRLLEEPDLRRELGRHARRFVEEHHGWTSSVKSLVRLYDEALARKRATS